MLIRAIEVLRTDGLRALMARSLQYVYETRIRNYLPRFSVRYNGVKVRAGRLLDPLIPGYSLHRPKYENAIVSGIQEHVRYGDRVAIVGGGWGVSAVVAADRAGSDSTIDVYEGSAIGVDRVKETARLNSLVERISVEHAIVGAEISLLDDSGGAPIMPADEIDNYDVLVLDCEGAELTILEEIVDRPSVIIVETHGFLGAPIPIVEKKLKHLGYAVHSRRIAEPDQRVFCEENGIYVLVATPET